MSSAFADAVLATACLAGSYRSGLQAIRGKDRQRITCQDGRRLTGSVDVDPTLLASHPEDNRWDYAIGVKYNSEHVVWVEIHPASSMHVQEVIDKLRWLRRLAEIGSGLTSRVDAILRLGGQRESGSHPE